MVSGTFCGQPAESIAYSDRNEVLHLAYLAQLVLQQRSTAEVPKVLFHRESHSQDLLRLQKNSVDLANKSFKIWGKMPSNPALETLGKDMRAMWTKNSEVEKQSISVGSGTKQVSSADVSARGQRD